MANFKYYNHKKNDFGDWKKSKDHNFHGVPNPGSYSSRKKLPPVNDRQLSAHQLEERFCSTVGGISWEDVVQNQKYMYQHEKILEWKDSAAEEAFRDAKNRFLAKIHNQPCDIKLPDQDVFIDKIDWNSTVDPKLLSDLENWEIDSSSEGEKHNGGVIVGIPSIMTQFDMTPSGWGDAEKVKPEPEYCSRHDQVGNNDWVDYGVNRDDLTPMGWGDAEKVKPQPEYCSRHDQVGNDRWVNYGVNRDDLTPAGWGDAEDVGNSHWDGNGEKKEEATFSNGWEDDCVHVPENTAWDGKNKVNGPTWDGYSKQRDNRFDRKGDHGGWSTSRYKISRFEHNNYGQPLDNYGGRKGNFSCDRSLYTWKPVSRRW
ncbi:uncharacterized protein LOC141657244 [Silene latifolia]|uniref:uncharacterized protein LOC141657244 n=1 Tax=Silene latifolia TaxID=37657 RepID=UPI003D76F179